LLLFALAQVKLEAYGGLLLLVGVQSLSGLQARGDVDVLSSIAELVSDLLVYHPDLLVEVSSALIQSFLPQLPRLAFFLLVLLVDVCLEVFQVFLSA
jgi:hypothetical protein